MSSDEIKKSLDLELEPIKGRGSVGDIALSAVIASDLLSIEGLEAQLDEAMKFLNDSVLGLDTTEIIENSDVSFGIPFMYLIDDCVEKCGTDKVLLDTLKTFLDAELTQEAVDEDTDDEISISVKYVENQNSGEFMCDFFESLAFDEQVDEVAQDTESTGDSEETSLYKIINDTGVDLTKLSMAQLLAFSYYLAVAIIGIH